MQPLSKRLQTELWMRLRIRQCLVDMPHGMIVQGGGNLHLPQLPLLPENRPLRRLQMLLLPLQSQLQQRLAGPDGRNLRVSIHT